jgi:SHS2 domain-containing protein
LSYPSVEAAARIAIALAKCQFERERAEARGDGVLVEEIEEIDHPSDAIVRVRAESFADLLAAAARACFTLMTDVSTVVPRIEREVRCEASERTDLLAAWLNELIGLAGAERAFYSDFVIQRATASEISAIVRGEPVDPARHPLHKEVKAATYHGLVVEERNGVWQATILFDL